MGWAGVLRHSLHSSQALQGVLQRQGNKQQAGMKGCTTGGEAHPGQRRGWRGGRSLGPPPPHPTPPHTGAGGRCLAPPHHLWHGHCKAALVRAHVGIALPPGVPLRPWHHTCTLQEHHPSGAPFLRPCAHSTLTPALPSQLRRTPSCPQGVSIYPLTPHPFQVAHLLAPRPAAACTTAWPRTAPARRLSWTRRSRPGQAAWPSAPRPAAAVQQYRRGG